MKSTESPGTVLTYAVCDKRTGRVVHIHRRYLVVEERKGERESITSASCECESEHVRKLVERDSFILSQVTDRDPKNLEVISTTAFPEIDSPSFAGVAFDPKSKTLVPRPRIQLHTDKTVLEGSGDDGTLLMIKIVDAQGTVVTDFEGHLKVSTTHGKLSERGGIVKVRKGVGEIRLVSAKETIDRVQVAARSVDSRCATGYLDLEFT